MSDSEWGTFNEALMLLASHNLSDIEDALDDAISKGAVRRRGNCACDDIMADQTIPQLSGKSKYQTVESVVSDGRCEINLHDVLAWARDLGFDTATTRATETRGRKIQKDWDAFWLAVCVELHDGGLAKTQAKFIDRVYARLNYKSAAETPGKTETEKRISQLYKALGLSR